MIFFTQRFHEVDRLCIAILSMSCDSRIVVFSSSHHKDSDIHGEPNLRATRYTSNLNLSVLRTDRHRAHDKVCGRRRRLFGSLGPEVSWMLDRGKYGWWFRWFRSDILKCKIFHLTGFHTCQVVSRIPEPSTVWKTLRKVAPKLILGQVLLFPLCSSDWCCAPVVRISQHYNYCSG